jgi:ATP-dependent HslUV protease ATP-binding subunit HslU
LKEKHFFDILNNKRNNLIIQYVEMFKTQNVRIVFKEDAIRFIAKIADNMNQNIENTGARRLRTIIDNVMEDLNFDFEEYKDCEFIIDEEYVKSRTSKLNIDLNLKKFVL